MPEHDPTIQAKLDALQLLTGADRKPAELVAVFWPEPSGLVLYASAAYDELPWWPDLASAIETEFGEAIPLTVTLIPDRTPFIDLPRAASISDDSINLNFSDLDGEFSDLLMDYGEGIRTEVFGYWPTVDLLLSLWRGMLHQPKEMDRAQVKITATSGWRAPQMLVPKRPFATSCPFIFGAHLPTQEAIDQHAGCPFNRHVGGTIGNPAFIGGDCPRRVKADCSARLTEDDGVTPTERYWPGFETREDAIPNNQTKGPNLLAKAIGNESSLSDPIRVIFGERYVKALYLLAFRIEENTNHPEDGFGAALFAVSEGHNLAMWEFRINGELVGAEHFQLRLGALGQQPTDWSPDVNSYSGTAHGYGRIEGDFRDAQASDFSGSVRTLGQDEVRVYSDVNTYVEGYTTNRVWCILHMLAQLRWGYGQDYPRFGIQSFIDAADWCNEYVTLTDPNSNTFSGVRSTFNAEVNPRAIQQQIKDACTAGRLGIPFEFEGQDVIVPLKAEDVDDPAIPTFTDEGPIRNIIYDGVNSSLSWSVISDESMTNQWTVNFDDASNGGVDTQFIFGDQAQQLRAGRAWGDRSKRVVNKSQAGYGINSAQEAARFGNSLLYLGPLDSGGILNPFSVKFTTWYSEAFNVQNYKLIKVVNAKLQSRMVAYFTARGLEPYPDADYTCFRVMKHTRKGDLRVEIEAQQYATLDEAPASECEISKNYGLEITTETFTRDDSPDDLGLAPNGQPWVQISGTWGIDSNEALIELENFEGTAVAVIETGIANGFFQVQIKDKTAGGTTFNLQNFGVVFRFVDINNFWYLAYRGAVDSIAMHKVVGGVHVGGAESEWGLGFADNDFIGVRTCGDSSEAYWNDTFLFEVNDSALMTATKAGLFAGAGVVNPPQPWRFDNFSFGAPDVDMFSGPRDFTATVNAVTGIVHYHWSPPLRLPGVVTGYTLYQSDAVTVVMATALVYDYEETLVPGTYTRRLRATDGSNNSAFVSVTFTVDSPPPDTLTLIDRDSGNIFIDRTTGDVMVSRAVPGG